MSLKTLILLVCGVSAVLIAGTMSIQSVAYTQNDTKENRLPEETVGEPTSLELTTDTWGIFDPRTGEVVVGSNLENQLPIASITKLFTAYAVLESGKEDMQVTVTWSDLSSEGRAGKLRYGQQISLRELLFPLLIESSNDAGKAIERALGESFDHELTAIIEELSLSQTSIYDATGLSDKNVSSVTDLATAYTHIRDTHPFTTDITQLRLYVGEKEGLVNNNPGRSLQNFTGGKQGYTPRAGKTFVGTFRQDGGGAEVGIVLLGSSDLRSDIEAMLTYAEKDARLSICYNAGTCRVTLDLASQ